MDILHVDLLLLLVFIVCPFLKTFNVTSLLHFEKEEFSLTRFCSHDVAYSITHSGKIYLQYFTICLTCHRIRKIMNFTIMNQKNKKNSLKRSSPSIIMVVRMLRTNNSPLEYYLYFACLETNGQLEIYRFYVRLSFI